MGGPMPTDLPANFGDALPAFSSNAMVLQQTLAATAAAQVPGQFIIKKGESLAKRKGVKSTATHYIIPFSIASVSNTISSCFQYNLNVNTPSLPAGFDSTKEFTSEFRSDTIGTATPTQSCIFEAGKTNINWKPGAKPVTATITISKKFLDALRNATEGDFVMTLTVTGYVEPAPADDDK